MLTADVVAMREKEDETGDETGDATGDETEDGVAL
jgi:hypothetical protein